LVEVGRAARASSIQAAITAPQPAAVLVVLGSNPAYHQDGTVSSSSSSASQLLVVDDAIKVVGVESLVLMSAAALQQAAAAAAAAAAATGAATATSLDASQLLAVDCKASKDGGFLRAR
jgi:hypothetical protein